MMSCFDELKCVIMTRSNSIVTWKDRPHMSINFLFPLRLRCFNHIGWIMGFLCTWILFVPIFFLKRNVNEFTKFLWLIRINTTRMSSPQSVCNRCFYLKGHIQFVFFRTNSGSDVSVMIIVMSSLLWGWGEPTCTLVPWRQGFSIQKGTSVWGDSPKSLV